MDNTYEDLVEYLKNNYHHVEFDESDSFVNLYHSSMSSYLKPRDDYDSRLYFHHSELGYGFYCFPSYEAARIARYSIVHHYKFNLRSFYADGGYVKVVHTISSNRETRTFPSPIPERKPAILFELGTGHITRDYGQVLLRDGAVNYFEPY